ncbi:cationic amino acid transporter 1-like [Juglans microcarpa x Juglans regia]|uniref:cationic amino acid transporter 1-like n=1 Tax=Juglans microcarpa x Juglans regia TaxID=2249226 RepID=UPI001B7DB3FF|nr:cationic amino acid transporter 1-like [Juglans microcarpa x Juglans regia]
MVSGTEDGGSGEHGNGIRKRVCMWSKQDLLPEESFQSWGNYVKALGSTKSRLKDRLLARSLDHLELQEMRSRSQHEMKKVLNWWDLIWFSIGAVMGAGIFVLTGEAIRNDAGPAVVISYIISGISALLSVLCYTEFAVELPVAGGSFAYLRVELGDFMAYIAAGNILFEYIVGGAGVARSWTSYFATLCNHKPNDFRITVSSLAEDYNHLDPIAIAISIAVCVGACLSIKGSSRFNSITTILHIIILIFIVAAGLTKANHANFETFMPFGIEGVLKASALLFFAYLGFDGVATLGEEVKNPGRDIPIGLIGSMSIVIVIYCILAATVSLMQPYTQVDADAPFTVAFQAVGMNWAKYIVAFGALKGMTTVLLANIIGQARYFTHIARTHMAPPVLAVINEKTGTPMNGTIIMTVANSIVAFFTSLDVLANLLSISTLFIFSLVAVALIVRRYYVTGETSDADRKKLAVFLALIIGSSICSAAYWALSNNGWVGYIVTVPVWFLATLGLKLTVKEARKPKMWGVPLVPWLPSACIAINVFIMGSIDRQSFVRFSLWTLVLLVYYIFVALHASYDAAKETERQLQATQGTNIEAGIVN